jgi:hypothetical protein
MTVSHSIQLRIKGNNRMQFMMDFLNNWKSNLSEKILSFSIQLGMAKGNNGINYME